jgi:flagellar L-ring protein precursor FlgH
MTTALLVALCLCADTPVSAPLPTVMPGSTPTSMSGSNRVLREDEKSGRRATQSATAAAIAAQSAAARSSTSDHPATGCLFEVNDPEPRAFAVHDLITIVVSENSKSKSSADAKADKHYSMAAEVGAFMSMDPTSWDGGDVNLDGTSLPAFDVSGGKGFKGKGTSARTDDFTARVTAEVIEVRPNGLLVLEARREIVNDGESQVILLSGICRPEDVSASNSVLSQFIADAVIKKLTTGQLHDTAEKGIIARILDSIFAF